MGYLMTVVLVALATVCALWPVRRPRVLARVGYLFAVVVNELPQVAAVWLVGWTVVAALEGDLAGPFGTAVLGVAAATVIGQAVLLARALAARRTVSRAVSEAVGVPTRARGLGDLLRILLSPYPARGRAIVRRANLQYAPGGRRHRLDAYHRRDQPSGGPVLVYLHGGGYFSGGKHREGRALLHRMARRGWVCLSANYRLRPQAGFPDHLVDAKTVIAWAREHAQEYGADPTTLVIAGSSAGGHLAMLAGLTPNDPALQPGFEATDTTVAAVVGLYGYYGWYYDSSPRDPVPSSPLAHDAALAPPTFLAHGDHDTYVPVDGARTLAAHLRAGSAQPVAYAELPGGQHGFDLFRSLRYEAVVDGVETFLATTVKAVR